MTKYNIEGGLDFYSELYKSLDIEENENKSEEDSNLCLITNKPLIEYHFKMNCGHKFNYIPLYLDIKNHKEKYNGMESTTSHLKPNEIRCPYCRNKQIGVLPHYEELGLSKIHGVNTINPNYISQSKYSSASKPFKPCEFLTPNPNFDSNMEETENENCQFFKCYFLGSKISKSDIELMNNENECYYCYSHRKKVINRYKKVVADKLKEDAKNAKIEKKEKDKQKAKEEKDKAKEEKQKAKEEKQKAKEEAKEELENTVMEFKKNSKLKKNDIVNTIVGKIDISSNEISEGCIAILKTGQNKGQKCCSKIITNQLCKRHYKMPQQESN